MKKKLTEMALLSVCILAPTGVIGGIASDVLSTPTQSNIGTYLIEGKTYKMELRISDLSTRDSIILSQNEESTENEELQQPTEEEQLQDSELNEQPSEEDQMLQQDEEQLLQDNDTMEQPSMTND